MIETEDPLLGQDAQRRASSRRNAAVLVGSVILSLLMLVVVLDGLRVFDAFGVQSATVRETVGDVTLEVEYPNVTRPGLASPFRITIEQTDRFGDEVVIAIGRDYFGLWDFNTVLPAPSDETGTPEVVVWTFSAPDDGVFVVQFDASIEPARQHGAAGRVAVLDTDGTEAVAVEFTTNIRP